MFGVVRRWRGGGGSSEGMRGLGFYVEPTGANGVSVMEDREREVGG